MDDNITADDTDDKVLDFIVDCINKESLYSTDGIPKPWGNGRVFTKDLFENYLEYLKQTKESSTITQAVFGKQLTKWMKPAVKHGKVRLINGQQEPCYKFAPIDMCKLAIKGNTTTTQLLDNDENGNVN